MERIDYEIENRQTVIDQLVTENRSIVEDVTINLNENGRLNTCYFIVGEPVDPEVQP